MLYHCADPINTLRKIFSSLKVGGEIIVDCQCIPDHFQSHIGENTSTTDTIALPLALFPRKTYGGASGMWFLPTRQCLLNWMARTQFRDIKVFYDEPLSVEEQR